MKTYKPYTKSRRHFSTTTFKGKLTAQEPYKPLTAGRKRHVGRSNGRISVRHKGGGHKRLFRDIDFSYQKRVPARVETVEYDPNRSGFIGLLLYRDGERRYALLPQSVKAGDAIETTESAPVSPGNRLPLKGIPIGAFVYNVELKPGQGGKMGRAAGANIEVLARDVGYVDLKMPSSEVRKVLETCWATVGQVSNEEHHLVKIGKAGRSRWMGVRPTVRGSAMNPVDHPYGGGEGRSGRGLRRAKTLWGKPAGKGQKTRRPKKYSNYLIVSRRKVGKRKKS
ncbi:50S ribosomal protein L2 [Candidatus Adlerbacteria bacterium RIFCSPHIGHO2_01_FULL_54_23]|uniref:Large ribosomal subunit protein uL2 n=3 Tax=Candidatus Adleribacteriota TaxID=1752736 RepID=A0A1F4Y0P0_9BACT|nr:MAG: 50S ribosomal protein L2 [Candidatus Adlerbacteria bacterium GW2011_GWA1_54_10]KKW36193.1 MAG: 50S ribosomal protein L2 [Candidatus Adlerbacteria bacterium GW2011_GWA2_54_12]KKW37327.1 MAG: 50S ribosomal protein L2 [Candidatus Adlerbacteria bacterium GW2011_GWB1_54_7]OGC78988.1 MAG: 50S ribosomal protein L2 [Candidatus Adlerbacteria bacterium RIFCSPHIGHO2_01_FULL_54_23]OGC87428.1 MAG: 50S ribosomal protein L2 [Candidatus Adlerbacteria bacterium RIFCSPLOWO2_01_FULL_54_16]